MTRLDTLRQKVEALYHANNPDADEWIDWGYPNHVLVVAKLAEKIATDHKANVELCVAGALLHDIADATMARERPEHEQESLVQADILLQESGFGADEAAFVVKEIIKPHSCNGVMPTVVEGKALATADGAAHLVTDFYPYFCWMHYGPQDDYQAYKQWVLMKLEKDFNKKLLFDDVKAEMKPRYEALKLVFSAGKETKV